MMPLHAQTTVHAMPIVQTDAHAVGQKSIVPITNHLLNSKQLSVLKSEIQNKKSSGARTIFLHNTNHQARVRNLNIPSV